jgi:(2Fe-2S) ferredoxin
VDHDAQLATLRASLPPGGRLYTVDCLGPCERSNVVVVRRGTSRHWFGEVLPTEVTADLAAWVAAGADGNVPDRLVTREFDPLAADETSGPTPERLDWDPGRIADEVEDRLRRRTGAWTFGGQGAIAEFVIDDDDRAEDVTIRREGDTVEAVTGRGGARLAVTAATSVFAFRTPGDGRILVLILAMPRAEAIGAGPAAVVAHRGPDVASIRPEDRGDELVDLGVETRAARFHVRTGAPEVLSALDSVRGETLPEALERIGPLLLQASPHRVVETAVGRAEVYGRLPRPEEPSPGGPHTHLLLGELELGRELPVGFDLPPEVVAGAVFYAAP